MYSIIDYKVKAETDARSITIASERAHLTCFCKLYEGVDCLAAMVMTILSRGPVES